MPGYGIRPEDEGTGLLPWSWAKRQLQTSRNFWVVTLWPDGRPHAMPVWGVFDDDELFWFSSAVHSRKALNIANDPRCTVTSEDEQHPVVLNGEGEIRTSGDELALVLELVSAKYATDYGMDLMDPRRTRRSACGRSGRSDSTLMTSPAPPHAGRSGSQARAGVDARSARNRSWFGCVLRV